MNITAAEAPPITDAERQSLSVLYQVTAADIVFFKQQQWSVMNYAVGLDIAVTVVAGQVLKVSPTPFAWWLLVVLSCGIPFIAFLALNRLHKSILARRQRLDQTRAMLGERFLKAWQVEKEPDDFYLFFAGVLLAGLAVTLWLVTQ
jgi:hypothetical protein